MVQSFLASVWSPIFLLISVFSAADQFTIYKLSLLEDPQVELHLLRSCLIVFVKSIIFFMLYPYFALQVPLHHSFDIKSQECLCRIIHSSIFNDVGYRLHCLLVLCFRIACLRTFSLSTFLGFYNFTCILVSRLVGTSDASMPLPGKMVPCYSLRTCPSQCPLFPLRIVFKQASLDDFLFTCLLSLVTISVWAALIDAFTCSIMMPWFLQFIMVYRSR